MFAKIGQYYRALKGVLKVKKEMTNLMEKKPGWKTSEMWLSVISIVLTVFFAVKSLINPAWALTALTVITVAYQITRTIAKATPSAKDDEFVAKLGEILAKFGIKPVEREE